MNRHQRLYGLLFLISLCGLLVSCTKDGETDRSDVSERAAVRMNISHASSTLKAEEIMASPPATPAEEAYIANAIIYPTDNTAAADTGGEAPFCVLVDPSMPFVAGTSIAANSGIDWQTDTQGRTVVLLPKSYHYYKAHTGTSGRNVKLYTFANVTDKAQAILLNTGLTNVPDLFNSTKYFSSDLDCNPPFFMTGQLKESTTFAQQSAVTLTRACAKVVIKLQVDDPNVNIGTYDYAFNVANPATIKYHKVNFPITTYIIPDGIGNRNTDATQWARRFVERGTILSNEKSFVFYVPDYNAGSTTEILAEQDRPRLHLNLPLTVQPPNEAFGPPTEINPQATVNNWYRLILPLHIERNRIYELTVHIASPGFPDPAYGQPTAIDINVLPWTDVSFTGDIGNDVTFSN